MKSPDFDYVKPTRLAQALSLLAEHEGEVQILAGGQSLLAMMNLRMSWPKLLVDITGLSELRTIALQGPSLRIGALVTHAQLLSSALVSTHVPLLFQSASHVAHLAIRNVGTIGGSLALADPSAEYPAVALCLNATLVLQGLHGERRVSAQNFFQGLYQTDLRAGELITAIEFASVQANEVQVFRELARRRGDYALVGMAMALRVKQGRIDGARLAFLAVGDQPVLALKTMQHLQGQVLRELALPACLAVLRSELIPKADLQAQSTTKAHWAGVLLSRALGAIGEGVA